MGFKFCKSLVLQDSKIMLPKTCTKFIRLRSGHASKFRGNLVPALLLGCAFQCALAAHSHVMAELRARVFEAQTRNNPKLVIRDGVLRDLTQVPMISSRYSDDLAQWAKAELMFETQDCENIVFIDGDQFMQPAFGRSTAGRDLIEKCSNTFFVLMSSVKCTDYAIKHLTPEDNPKGHFGFSGYLETHPRVWASLYIPTKKEAVDNKLRALAIWMCHKLRPYVKRCVLISNDNAISCGRQLRRKNDNWGGRVLRDSLLEILPGAVIPLKQDDYHMRDRDTLKTVLDADRLTNDIMSKSLDECLVAIPKITLPLPKEISPEEIEARRAKVLAAKAAKLAAKSLVSPKCTLFAGSPDTPSTQGSGSVRSVSGSATCVLAETSLSTGSTCTTEPSTSDLSISMKTSPSLSPLDS